jgi:hypothetical protein
MFGIVTTNSSFTRALLEVNGLICENYKYDLVSGKVNLVKYQHGQTDQFYYQYKYDAENRLTEAWSSIEASVTPYGFGSRLTDPYRKLDASYEYYLHGPLPAWSSATRDLKCREQTMPIPCRGG